MKTWRQNSSIPASSMADVAFLLLLFFMVTTHIVIDKGLLITLPSHSPGPNSMLERNVLKIMVNSADQLLVNGQLLNPEDLHHQVKGFVLNQGTDPRLSTSPEDAVVSLKADRGSSHQKFVSTLDAIHRAYHEIYADRLGISVDQFLQLNKRNQPDLARLEKATKGIPMRISIAELGQAVTNDPSE